MKGQRMYKSIMVRSKPEVAHIASICIPLIKSATWPLLTAQEARICSFLCIQEEKKMRLSVYVTGSKKISFFSS